MFCAHHADREMVSICNKKCTHPGCTLAALHAPGGGAGPHEVCARHAAAGGGPVGGNIDDKKIPEKKTAAVVRKKRGPYRKRVYQSAFATVEPSQGAKRGRPAGSSAAAKTTTASGCRGKRTRADERRRDRARNDTEPTNSSGKGSPARSLRLLLQTDDEAGWAVLDWNWKSAQISARPMPYY